MELLFLSFTTLTSTGLSDIVPVQAFARSLVMIEQLAGCRVHRDRRLPAGRPHGPAADELNARRCWVTVVRSPATASAPT